MSVLIAGSMGAASKALLDVEALKTENQCHKVVTDKIQSDLTVIRADIKLILRKL